MKKSVLVLLALALSLASACSGGSNPNAPSPVTAVPGGGSGTAITASIASWGLYRSSACSTTVTCDSSQVIRPNSAGRYEIGRLGYRLLVTFNNPRVPGRSIEFKMLTNFTDPPETPLNRFGQVDAGTPSLMSIKVNFDIAYNVKTTDPVAIFEATESGPGLDSPTLMKLTIPVQLME